jgi:hypothetical protein
MVGLRAWSAPRWKKHLVAVLRWPLVCCGHSSIPPRHCWQVTARSVAVELTYASIPPVGVEVIGWKGWRAFLGVSCHQAVVARGLCDAVWWEGKHKKTLRHESRIAGYLSPGLNGPCSGRAGVTLQLHSLSLFHTLTHTYTHTHTHTHTQSLRLALDGVLLNSTSANFTYCHIGM